MKMMSFTSTASAEERVRSLHYSWEMSSQLTIIDVVRAVAGFLHHMRLPHKMAPESFDFVYKRGLELISAVRKGDKRKSGQVS